VHEAVPRILPFQIDVTSKHTDASALASIRELRVLLMSEINVVAASVPCPHAMLKFFDVFRVASLALYGASRTSASRTAFRFHPLSSGPHCDGFHRA
jgi:hypothetical protein